MKYFSCPVLRFVGLPVPGPVGIDPMIRPSHLSLYLSIHPSIHLIHRSNHPSIDRSLLQRISKLSRLSNIPIIFIIPPTKQLSTSPPRGPHVPVFRPSTGTSGSTIGNAGLHKRQAIWRDRFVSIAGGGGIRNSPADKPDQTRQTNEGGSSLPSSLLLFPLHSMTSAPQPCR